MNTIIFLLACVEHLEILCEKVFSNRYVQYSCIWWNIVYEESWLGFL